MGGYLICSLLWSGEWGVWVLCMFFFFLFFFVATALLRLLLLHCGRRNIITTFANVLDADPFASLLSADTTRLRAMIYMSASCVLLCFVVF